MCQTAVEEGDGDNNDADDATEDDNSEVSKGFRNIIGCMCGMDSNLSIMPGCDDDEMPTFL